MRTANRLKAPLLILAALLCLPIVANAELQKSEISRGAMLSNTCAGCHGTDGKSPGAVPSINGKPKEFLEMAIKKYRSGEWDSTVMRRHVRGYTDEEISLIAEYFASKK